MDTFARLDEIGYTKQFQSRGLLLLRVL